MYIFDETSAATPAQVGNKAFSLLILRKHFIVPEFVVIAAAAYSDYLDQGKMPDRLAAELHGRLGEMLALGPVAVRSSGTAEDLPSLSFAGMYETVLNVVDETSARKAIVRVWDSNRSSRVEAYRKQHGAKAGLMAVIIQRQLAPEVSGVMVTRSPFSSQEIMIECCRGLGEPLVSGKIAPSRYRVAGDLIQKPEDGDLLDENQVRELAEAGRKIERLFQSPQGIEWSLENGRLVILQSRPITVHGAVPRRRCTVWSNVNLRETIPDPVSPMGWSVFNDFIFYAIIRNALSIPVTESQYLKFPMVERLLGRLYWNLNNCLAYGAAVGPALAAFRLDSLDPQLADAAKAVDLKNLPRPIPSSKLILWGPQVLFRLFHYMLRGFIQHRSISRRTREMHEKSDRWVSQLSVSADPEVGLENILRWLRIWFGLHGRLYFSSIFIGLFQMVILIRLLAKCMGKKGEALARRAIFGILDSTGEMARAMGNLGLLARARIPKDPILKEDLQSLVETDPEFHSAYWAFLADFGHRGPGEFDLGQPNWRDDPSLTLDVILIATQARPYEINRAAALAEIMRTATPPARFLLWRFLPRLESLTPLRENGKHHYFKFAARLKDQLGAIAATLRIRGYLQADSDIYYLTLSDMRSINRRQLAPRECQALIDGRKVERQRNISVEPPDIIYESGERITAPPLSGASFDAEPLTFGRVRARARIVADFNRAAALRRDEILVTHHSDPGWTPLFMVASGVIVEVGGLICHAAMVARELGIPAVVLKNATRLIPDGALVEIDADRGAVRILD
jgi:pyruvate,water dikinase